MTKEGSRLCREYGDHEVSLLTVKDCSGDFTGIGAYVATDNARREVVVAVRGSTNVRNFITDVFFSKQDCNFASGCKIHTGFGAAWDEISGRIKAAVRKAIQDNPDYRVVATGYSLGAAVATLAAAYLRDEGLPVDLYTYGSPRVGNDVFADYVSNQPGNNSRVTHQDDPIPRVPPIFFDYRHVSPEYWLSTGTAENVDFGVDDVRVCAGNANIDCNAGAPVPFTYEAHLYYFRKMSACGRKGIEFKRDGTLDFQVFELLQTYQKADDKVVAYIR